MVEDLKTILTPDSTILSIAATQSELWLATDSGLWRGGKQDWAALTAPAALDFVATIISINAAVETEQLLVAAGLPAGFAYSPSNGRSWYSAATDPIDSSITCIVASPRFAHDRVLLAGTEVDGMLRSSDGGRHWQLANVGLTEFAILALATAPSWSNREDAFVATDSALYRSPNGGRAWKRSALGLEEQIVQALLVSPNYAIDQMVFAGCEAGPIYASYNQGRSWVELAHTPVAVNTLWAHPAIPSLFLAGTSNGQIARSVDAGQQWQLIHQGNDAILSFAAYQGLLYAGCYQGGLLCSADQGNTWQQLF